MATPDKRVFGLTPSKKGALSNQQIAGSILNPDENTVQMDPTAVFSRLPLGSAPTPVTNAPAIAPRNTYAFTGKYDAYDRDLQAQEADASLARRTNIQKVAEAFLRSTQDAAKDKDKAFRSLQAMLASRGTLNSGINLDETSELNTNYMRYLDDLARAKAGDESGIETGYATTLNSLYRKRDTLFAEQQAEEEARKIEQARMDAETARQQTEAQARQQELEAIRTAQEQARAAAAAAPAYASPVYTPPAIGGGGGGYSAPYEEPPPAAPVAEERIISPFARHEGNVPPGAVEAWAKRTIDPNLSGNNLRAVVAAMTNAGARGLTRTELARIIAQNSQPQNQDFFY